MDKAKVKNLIILALLLTNVFLLYLMQSDRQEARAGEAAAWHELTAVFDANGIRLSDKARAAQALDALSLRRSLREEQRAVERLLGTARVENRGGNIYEYTTDKGFATFRSTGEFEIWLEEGAVHVGSDPVQTALDVLKKLGIDGDKAAATLRDLSGGWEVVITARLGDSTVYNARATFTFTTGSLLSVFGVRLPDGDVGRGEAGMDSGSLLMHFLRAALEGGYVCSEVSDLVCGYRMDTSVTGDVSLVPVWCVVTDTGEYYLDAITGREEPFA